MKCVSCSIEVSSNFVAAIMENSCPACGETLMSVADFKKLIFLKKQLSSLNLNLDAANLTKVSAAIVSKFELWPREDEAKNADDNSAEKSENDDSSVLEEEIEEEVPLTKKTSRASPKPIRAVGRDFEDEDEQLTPQQRKELIAQFGLDKGDASQAKLMLDQDPEKFKNNELAQALLNHNYDSDEDELTQDRMNRAKSSFTGGGPKGFKRL